MRITSAKEARENIGNKVYWDDISNRYHFIRCGYLEEVSGKNICVDGNWVWLTELTNIRTTEEL